MSVTIPLYRLQPRADGAFRLGFVPFEYAGEEDEFGVPGNVPPFATVLCSRDDSEVAENGNGDAAFFLWGPKSIGITPCLAYEWARDGKHGLSLLTHVS